jgi:hypothetical protein
LAGERRPAGSVPLSLIGPSLVLTGLRIKNNLYTQIGIILLIVLSAKNAILIVETSLCFRGAKRKLARVRGFASENADFEIFETAKYLICKGWGLQLRPRTSVVKTYPIPKRCVMQIDSLHHVSATHRAKEERQDAQLLERGRE